LIDPLKDAASDRGRERIELLSRVVKVERSGMLGETARALSIRIGGIGDNG
jgi:hypothetical protein